MRPDILRLTEFEEESLRQRIRRSIQDPIDEIVLLFDHMAGNFFPPDSSVLIDRLTLEKCDRFYQLVREELERTKSEGGVKFSDNLEDTLNPNSGNQSTFDHELSHVRIADELGVPLEECKIELFFSLSGWGLSLVHRFIPPENIDPMTMAQIALAPQTPSGPDLSVVKKVLVEGGTAFEAGTENFEIIAAAFKQRTGKEIDSILVEGSR